MGFGMLKVNVDIEWRNHAKLGTASACYTVIGWILGIGSASYWRISADVEPFKMASLSANPTDFGHSRRSRTSRSTISSFLIFDTAVKSIIFPLPLYPAKFNVLSKSHL